MKKQALLKTLRMNISINPAPIIAQQLLARLENLTKGELFTPGDFVYYENGREHGYGFVYQRKNALRCVFWSEYRNTDQIVVYDGPVPAEVAAKINDTNSAAGVMDALDAMDDAAYISKKFFACGDYERAVTYIIQMIRRK